MQHHPAPERGDFDRASTHVARAFARLDRQFASAVADGRLDRAIARMKGEEAPDPEPTPVQQLADACKELAEGLGAFVEGARETFDALPADERNRAMHHMTLQDGLAFACKRRVYWRAVRSRGATLRLVGAHQRRVRRGDHPRARRTPSARRAGGIRSGVDPGNPDPEGEAAQPIPTATLVEVVA